MRTKSLFGYDRSVPFPHTNDRFLPFRKVENGTAVWHNMKLTLPFHNGTVATSSIFAEQALSDILPSS